MRNSVTEAAMNLSIVGKIIYKNLYTEVIFKFLIVLMSAVALTYGFSFTIWAKEFNVLHIVFELFCTFIAVSIFLLAGTISVKTPFKL